ncbi:MAG: Crp/Fnr family transcriptional regulator, partial [Desulfobacterales bacterium]|nr:Crp/Fnr family transcriptional regulator [Desulfobacterales bacterium]
MISLEELDVINSLTQDELREIAPLFIQESYRKKDLIFSEGDPPKWLYFVLEGEVKITKLSHEGKEIILELIQPGGFFGAVAVIRGFPYPANAVAKENATVMKLSKADLDKILERFPSLMRDFMMNLGDRIKESRETTKNIALDKVHTRIAALLLKLADQVGENTSEGIVLHLKLTKQDIAEMVGTTV